MARKKTDAQITNDETYLMYFNRLRDYALSMFEWEGLPDSVNERFLELTMIDQGQAVFFEDPSLGMMALPVMWGGAVNAYHEPTWFDAVSIGYNRRLTPDKAVIMWNNYSRQPITPILRAFAERLTRVERAMDVNIRQQKFPYLVLAEESQRLTLQHAVEQYDGNEPFIFGNKSGFDKEAFQVLTTPVPYVADKLMEYKHNLWNEVMTFLGIGNAKQDKKERLVSDEVAANDEQIQSSRYIMLKARQDACEQIKKLFGISVSVDFKLNKEKERLEEKAEAKGDGRNNSEND